MAFLTLLISLLGLLIEWLNSRASKGIALTPNQKAKVDHALYLFQKIEREAAPLGCVPRLDPTEES